MKRTTGLIMSFLLLSLLVFGTGPALAQTQDGKKARDELDGFEEGSEAKDPFKQADMIVTDIILNSRVRAGRQIVALGASDYARITDVVNPRDLTRPGLLDLEEARLSVAAIRLSKDLGGFTLDAVTVHEHPGSRIGGQGSDFDYYQVLRNPGIAITGKDTPDSGLDSTGLILQVKYFFNGGEVALVAADTFDDQPVLAFKGVTGGVLEFTPEYSRMRTLGLSSSLARNKVLFKAEAAFRQGRDIQRNDGVSQVLSGVPENQVRTFSEKDRILALAGMEYTGIKDLRLNFEAGLTHTLGHEATLSVEKNEVTTYFTATRKFWNETLSLELFWVTLNPGMGSILRFSAAYDLMDGLNLEAGVAFYGADSSRTGLYPYQDQDRVYLKMKYSF